MDTNLTVPSKVNWKKFTQRNLPQATELEEVPAVASDAVIKAKETVDTPVVYIPVFPGTNSEYDSAKAFEKKVQRSTWYHL